MGDVTEIENREQLVWALHRASEMEQLLMCMYLSAAFSIRKANEDIKPAHAEQARRWEMRILKIARQEMEHLALVNNLLIGIGAEPYFGRPNFPLKHYLLDEDYLAFPIEPFSLASVGRFVLFEAPDDWGPHNDYGISKELVLEYVRADPCTQGLETWKPPSASLSFRSVQDLYTAIDNAIKNDPYRPELADLFAGSGAKEPFKDFQFNFQFNIFTFPVTDIQSANAAVDLILEQGEGLRSQPGFSSHFGLFSEIFKTLRATPGFEPAWNVVCNPSDANITNDFALRLIDLFNHANATMLYMLSSFYTFFSPSSSDSSPNRISTALQSTAFAPMMTMVIRPLGEIITRLPSGAEGSFAGPNWRIPESDEELTPSTDPAFFIGRLRDLATGLDQARDAAPEHARERLGFMYQNVYRVARNFEQITSA